MIKSMNRWLDQIFRHDGSFFAWTTVWIHLAVNWSTRTPCWAEMDWSQITYLANSGSRLSRTPFPGNICSYSGSRVLRTQIMWTAVYSGQLGRDWIFSYMKSGQMFPGKGVRNKRLPLYIQQRRLIALNLAKDNEEQNIRTWIRRPEPEWLEDWKLFYPDGLCSTQANRTTIVRDFGKLDPFTNLVEQRSRTRLGLSTFIGLNMLLAVCANLSRYSLYLPSGNTRAPKSIA